MIENQEQPYDFLNIIFCLTYAFKTPADFEQIHLPVNPEGIIEHTEGYLIIFNIPGCYFNEIFILFKIDFFKTDEFLLENIVIAENASAIEP